MKNQNLPEKLNLKQFTQKILESDYLRVPSSVLFNVIYYFTLSGYEVVILPTSDLDKHSVHLEVSASLDELFNLYRNIQYGMK